MAQSPINFTLTLSAEAPKRQLSLSPGQSIVVGRASRSDAKNLRPLSTNALFDCPVVSRQHAELRCQPIKYAGRVAIVDCGSMHGTSVNSKRLEPHKPWVLRSGDVIRIGDKVTRFSRPAPAAGASTTSGTNPGVLVVLEGLEMVFHQEDPPASTAASGPTATATSHTASPSTLHEASSFLSGLTHESKSSYTVPSASEDESDDDDSFVASPSSARLHPTSSAMTTPEQPKSTAEPLRQPSPLAPAPTAPPHDIIDLTGSANDDIDPPEHLHASQPVMGEPQEDDVELAPENVATSPKIRTAQLLVDVSSHPIQLDSDEDEDEDVDNDDEGGEEDEDDDDDDDESYAGDKDSEGDSVRDYLSDSDASDLPYLSKDIADEFADEELAGEELADRECADEELADRECADEDADEDEPASAIPSHPEQTAPDMAAPAPMTNMAKPWSDAYTSRWDVLPYAPYQTTYFGPAGNIYSNAALIRPPTPLPQPSGSLAGSQPHLSHAGPATSRISIPDLLGDPLVDPARHVPSPPEESLPSPFDYAEPTGPLVDAEPSNVASANSMLGLAEPAAPTGTKRKADDMSTSDDTSSAPHWQDLFNAINTMYGEAATASATAAVDAPVPPPAKKTKVVERESSQVRRIAKSAAMLGASAVAGGIGMFLFLASPLAQSIVEWSDA